MKFTPPPAATLLHSRWLLPALLAGALCLGWLTSKMGVLVPGLLIAVPFLVFFLVLVFYYPRIGFISFIIYCFLNNYLSRHIITIPVGLGMESILIITWLAVLFHRTDIFQSKRIRNDLCLLSLIWFVINVLELGNPAGASITGWFYEMRSTTLLWVLTVPLGYLLFALKRDLSTFLYLLVGFSVLGTLYGIKQKLFGVDAMEQYWLDQGAARTHVLWGRLRVFSYYSDAAQFGASQAHIALICLIMALGPYSWKKRLLLIISSAILLYGMLISGTRGAFFVLIIGVFIYLALSRQIKILLLGCLIAGGVFWVMKYTTIGNSNPDIFRLRSALNPEDPSLLVRLNNQAILRDYLATRPLGGGVGVIGAWGIKYNPNKFLSRIPPDSYFVKIWAEYGIVGFLLWFGITLFILGKCMGIVWRLKDPDLRQKLLALTAGYGGILICTYSNEIINQMPSAMIIYISWVFIFMGPTLDTPQLRTMRDE
ncbi:O-antigen ligase family protein [Hymenobacter profundi]|uniref:O-antigen ligase family protein n=1 Tax=Hymenobacter profundi TaxID=1982110 RepID=A0ABS6WWN3_9BACT|nr:O-antigen ligase family protein [Hymenobacter profundi]MBW3127682.1 O-antigen ligase family protein [Hymenobacter profundi]